MRAAVALRLGVGGDNKVFQHGEVDLARGAGGFRQLLSEQLFHAFSRQSRGGLSPAGS